MKEHIAFITITELVVLTMTLRAAKELHLHFYHGLMLVPCLGLYLCRNV